MLVTQIFSAIFPPRLIICRLLLTCARQEAGPMRRTFITDPSCMPRAAIRAHSSYSPRICTTFRGFLLGALESGKALSPVSLALIPKSPPAAVLCLCMEHSPSSTTDQRTSPLTRTLTTNGCKTPIRSHSFPADCRIAHPILKCCRSETDFSIGFSPIFWSVFILQESKMPCNLLWNNTVYQFYLYVCANWSQLGLVCRVDPC